MHLLNVNDFLHKIEVVGLKFKLFPATFIHIDAGKHSQPG